MSVPRLQEVRCERTFHSRGSQRCPQHGLHRCKRVFPLRDYESETLAGVGNRGHVQYALAEAKHAIHLCDCGVSCRVGEEELKED